MDLSDKSQIIFPGVDLSSQYEVSNFKYLPQSSKVVNFTIVLQLFDEISQTWYLIGNPSSLEEFPQDINSNVEKTITRVFFIVYFFT